MLPINYRQQLSLTSILMNRLARHLPPIDDPDPSEVERASFKRRQMLIRAAERIERIMENPPRNLQGVKVPKAFYIRHHKKYLSAGEMVHIYKFCKANPGVGVRQTLNNWWGGTTEDVLAEIRQGIHERIYLRQFIK